MEANTKQQQLLFDKGITNVPSDNLCSDNTLAESVGTVYDNGEHRVIQEPKLYISKFVWRSTDPEISGCKILYVHKHNDLERYICTMPFNDGSTTYDVVVWGIRDGGTIRIQDSLASDNAQPSPHSLSYDNSMKFTSIGKTLVICCNSGLIYQLWLTDEDSYNVYKWIGNKIPEFDFDCWMYLPSQFGQDSVGSQSKYDGILTEGADGLLMWELDAVEEYNDLVVGLYSKNLKTIAEKKAFAEPFYIRLALELYDGTYHMISQPVLMFPSVHENSVGMASSLRPGCLELYTDYSYLHITQKTDFSEFSDIVKDVVVFITDGINLYDLSADQPLTDITSNDIFTDRIYRHYNETVSSYVATTWTLQEHRYHVLKERDERELINDIKSQSVFYRLCSLGLSPVTDIDLGEKIDSHTLENLTVQEALDFDDYYSRCKLWPEFTYSYNSRLNLSGVKRGFFEGFGFFMPWDNNSASTYDIFVTIKTDYGNVVVKHTTSSTYQKMGYYFYYPDARATNVVIKQGNTVVLDTKLTEHPGLNGAYYFAGLPASTPPSLDTSGQGSTAVTTNPKEPLYNYIIQSEVNNPWVFQAQGYFAVGTGKIIGMSSITQALSEGQFGSFPLLVFSESGVWALSVASTGYYSSIHPMSREVCNNADSITQTDGAVFFTSEKGMMVVVGSQVKCVSEQLSGMNDSYAVSMYGATDPLFPSTSLGNVTNYFRNCMMAYDYRDSLLWIFSRYSATYCYIYSIKSGTFSKYRLASPVQRCVNYYPDYLLQGLDGNVLSLLNRSNINYDTHTATVDGQTVTLKNQYSATMLTRPLKLENALALKSIMHVKHIKQFSSYEISGVPLQGYLTFRIFASNNLVNWVEIGSLRGVPWKYYRFRYDFVNLIATDRFAGTILVTQERRTDKLK